MQTITLDKKSDLEISDASVDLQPGAKVILRASVKANDEQTLTLTVEEIEVPERTAEDDAEDDAAADAAALGLDDDD